MNAHTRHQAVAGPAGQLSCAIDEPAGQATGLAVLCHPHPLHGGTMDNKVVQTLARAAVQQGLQAVRFDFRGVRGSAGVHDHGAGEVDDVLAVVRTFAGPGGGDGSDPPGVAPRQLRQPLVLGGFSFGAAMAVRAAERLARDGSAPDALVLVGPAVVNFPPPPVPETLRGRTLVVHGEADDVVPLAGVLDWARPQQLPVVVVPGAGHFFHGLLALLKALAAPGFAAPAAR